MLLGLVLLGLVVVALFVKGFVDPKPFDVCTCPEADRCRHAQNDFRSRT